MATKFEMVSGDQVLQEIEDLCNRAEEDEDEDDYQGGRLPSMLEELKGDDPKIFGFDYYSVIYSTAGFLAVVMAYLYIILEDIELRKMLML